jgi:hypothetical protein
VFIDDVIFYGIFFVRLRYANRTYEIIRLSRMVRRNALRRMEYHLYDDARTIMLG